MLNYIWAIMIILGVFYGVVTGNIEAVGNGAIESAKEAVALCITMVGVMSMWMGFMNAAGKSGLISKMENLMAPIIKWLFPNLPKEHKARQHITTNIIANILGLGWAATPAGLKAMEELEKEPVIQKGVEVKGDKLVKRRGEKCYIPKHIASNEMCTFLVINISSLQLIPVNMIAYRSQYGAVNPALIVMPAILATSISTLAGIIFCKLMCRK